MNGELAGSEDRIHCPSFAPFPWSGGADILRRMRSGRRPTRTWLGFCVGVAVIAVGWYAMNPKRKQPALGSTAILNDGRPLTLFAVTTGLTHQAKRGSLWARFLNWLPASSVPNWRWLHASDTSVKVSVARFSEPHLVLWFRCPPDAPSKPPLRTPSDSRAVPPRLPEAWRSSAHSSFLRWKVIAPDGTAHGDKSRRRS